jgi:hypothetical protein
MSAGRAALRVAAIVATALALLVAALVLVLQASWARAWLKTALEHQAERYANARVQIGALRGSLIYGATLQNVSIHSGGQPVIEIAQARVAYDPLTLIAGHVDLKSLVLDRPVVHLSRQNGRWSIISLMRSRPPSSSSRPRFALRHIEIHDGVVQVGAEPAVGRRLPRPQPGRRPERRPQHHQNAGSRGVRHRSPFVHWDGAGHRRRERRRRDHAQRRQAGVRPRRRANGGNVADVERLGPARRQPRAPGRHLRTAGAAEPSLDNLAAVARSMLNRVERGGVDVLFFFSY